MRWQRELDRPLGAALACGQLQHPYAKLNAPRDASKVPTWYILVAGAWRQSERLGMRLLLVEDNEELAQLLTQRLQAAGYETDLLTTAGEAHTAVTTTRYPALVLHLPLPPP